MLQYILSESDRYPVAELAQMAIEGGCMWISLHLTGKSDQEIREMLVPDVVDMCREASVFLTIDDRPELARELGLHGVRLSREWFVIHPAATPASMREDMGPEAVIGIEAVDSSAVPAMVPADIDFVTVPASIGDDRLRAFVIAVRDAGIKIPLVAEGDFDLEDIPTIFAMGYNGLAVGKPITDAGDPVTATGSILDIISNAQ
ncbi:MAG: thiamine phosphate synthase [Bacteroidales bacterium]|nr:thiamine phosphate synthase [Bacteroidales bacterium]